MLLTHDKGVCLFVCLFVFNDLTRVEVYFQPELSGCSRYIFLKINVISVVFLTP